MKFFDFYCPSCDATKKDEMVAIDFTSEDHIDCPVCGNPMNVDFGGFRGDVNIPDSFRAVGKRNKGAAWANERFRKYKGQNKQKRFY